MPCFNRERKKFEIIKEEVQQMQKAGAIPSDVKDEKRKAIEELYARAKEKYESHKKELERLKKRLREAKSELERAQLEKEIAELEKELEGYHGSFEDMSDFIRDLERRTVNAPSQERE